MKIIVCTSELWLFEQVSKAIKVDGHEVKQINCLKGKELSEQAEEENPDLIIINASCCSLRVHDTVKNLLKIPLDSEIVLALEDTAILRDLHSLGVYEFIRRPIDIMTLRIRLRSIIGHRQAVMDQKEIQDMLREREKKFRLLAENARDIVYRICLIPKCEFEYVSPAVKTITGYTPQQHYDDPYLWCKIACSGYENILEQIREGKTDLDKPIVSKWTAKNGRTVWVEKYVTPVYDSSGQLVAIEGIARDITERKRIEDQLYYMSMHDALTGVYNRAYFEEEMKRLKNGRYDPFGLVMIDLDGLKTINDTYGHTRGDVYLKLTAKVLKECFREGDVVARVGGDEFAVLLPNTPEEAVKKACRRVKEKAAEVMDDNLQSLSLSIGIATRENSDITLDELFRKADDNMYREKIHLQKSLHNNVIQALMKALEARDFGTERHCSRLKELVEAVGKDLGFNDRQLADLRLLAQFHDIGKVGIADHIFFKPAPLTFKERKEMQHHTVIGHRIAMSTPNLSFIADLILKHHERWDGKGYPLGLKGEEVPIECRILSIADAYDAMTSDRAYRKAISHEAAVVELKRCAGTQFDPFLVGRFIKILEDELKNGEDVSK